MKIDVTFRYSEGFLDIRSEITNINIKEPSVVLMGKIIQTGDEKIESIGVSEEELKIEMQKHPDYNAERIYRFIDPFNIKSFDPQIARNVIVFYCIKVQLLNNPKFSQLKLLFGIDRFIINIFLPGYSSLPNEIKNDFEKQLKTVGKHPQINISPR